MVQFVAFFGALLFGRLAARQGAKKTILMGLVIWMRDRDRRAVPARRQRARCS